MKPLTIITCTAATIAALSGTALGDLHTRDAQRTAPTTDVQLQRIAGAPLPAIHDRITPRS